MLAKKHYSVRETYWIAHHAVAPLASWPAPARDGTHSPGCGSC